MSQFNQQFITLIIDRYRLEPDDEHINGIVATWMGQYDRTWIVKAIVEALHRGRYKIKSVDSILSGWQRTGKPSYNFPPEFEREILQDLPSVSDLAEVPAPLPPPQLEDIDPVFQFLGLSSAQLNPEESAPFVHHDGYRSNASPFSPRHYALAEPALCAYGTVLPTISSKFPPSVRHDRRQAVRATPVLQPSTLDRSKNLSQPEVDSLRSPRSVWEVSANGENNVNLNQVTSHPKFQLFHTLRAIITPNQAQASGFDDLDPPSYSTDLA